MGLLRLSMIGGVGLACLLALGCNREEPIKAYQAPREPARVHHERLEWKTPGEWIEWPGPDEQSYGGFLILEGQPPFGLTINALPREGARAGGGSGKGESAQRGVGVASNTTKGRRGA